MLTATVKKVDGREGFGKLMETGGYIDIAEYPWGSDYQPKAQAIAGYDEGGIWIGLRAYTEKVKADAREMNGPTYADSCMEVYLAPCPDENMQYFTFEMNIIGTLALGFGGTGRDRSKIEDVDWSIFKIEALDDIADYKGPYWQLVYYIPFDFIKKYEPTFKAVSGGKMRANFFKCGMEEGFAHWGCWSPINTPQPNYGVPECFGELVLE